MTSTIKPEVHNVSLRRQRRTETQQEVICIKKLVKIGRVVPKIWSRTDKQTDRHAHHNTPPAYRGQGKKLQNSCRYLSCPGILFITRGSGQELGFKVRIMFGVRSVWEQISGGQILTSNSEIVFWKVFNEIYCL